MLRVRLLTATAAVALFAGSSALAQEVMTPPAPTPQTAPATAPAAPAVTNTVIDVLKADGQFTTLVAALDAAQLTETLRSQGAISIFAPTDAAFAALPEADRTRLMDPANVNELRQLLLYHVVVADVNSSQIKGTKGGVETAATTEVQLDGTGDAIKVDGATVTTADIDASNGAIFAIDKVLTPAAAQVATGAAGEADAAIPTPPPATAPADEADATALPAGEADETMTPPAATTPPPPTTAATTMTRPAAPGTNAPNGQPAATTTTVAAPPVPNPTDGQVDDEDMDDADKTPTPAPAPKPHA